MTSILYYLEDENGVEHEYIIEGDVEPYTPARRYGHPDSWAPAEGGGACDIQVWKSNNGQKGEEIDYDAFLKMGAKADDIDQKLFDAANEEDDYDYEPDDYDY